MEFIPYQPIPFYKLNPSGSDLLIGQTAWENTAYHKRLETCGFIGPDYCHPVKFTDKLSFQFKLETTGSDVIQPSVICLPSATNSSVTSFKLVDATATFMTNGVDINFLVQNTSTGIGTYVMSVDSETELTLYADIFTSTPQQYQICTVILGDNASTNDNNFVSDGSSSIMFDNALTVDSYYKVSVTVTDITAGSFGVYLGSNIIGTIDSIGTHILYGKCESNSALNIVGDFIGSIDMPSITALELVMDYTLAAFDLDGNFVSALGLNQEAPEAFGAWSIGNGCFSVEWGNLISECGSYVLALYSGLQDDCGQMVVNGDFAEGSSGWTLGDDIFIDAGQALFAASSKDGLMNTLFCPIKAGHSYTLTYTLGQYLGTKAGTYVVYAGGTAISPTFNAASQTTVTLTFTAAADASTITFEYVPSTALTFTMDNVSLVCNDCTLVQDDAEGISECYCVCDNQDCTILLKYSNNVNAFGICYDNNFELNLRLPASVQSSNITDLEFIKFKNAMHSMTNAYWNGQKIEELATNLLPNWVHEAITTALKHHTLTIDGVQYMGLEEHSPIIEQTEIFGAKTKIVRVNQKYLNNIR